MPVSSCQCRVSCRIDRPDVSTAACRCTSYLTARSTDRSEFTFLVSVRVPECRVAGTVGLLARVARREGEVHVAAQRALLHPYVAHAEAEQQVPQLRDVRLGDQRDDLARAHDRLGDDLDERDAGAVVVDERVVGAVDATGRAADVQRLAGVLLHVGALDVDAHGLRPVGALDDDVGPALEGDRLVVLRRLEVLRHVRVEVVLPGEPAPLRDLAVERQPDPDRRLHRDRVDDGHRPGQPQAGRAGLGVGLGAELRRAAAEHLRVGVQLDVHLEPEGRVEALQRLVVGHQLVVMRRHDRPFAWSSSGPPHLSISAASRAAPDAVDPVVLPSPAPGSGRRPAGRPRRPGRSAPRCRARRRGWPGWWPGR